MGSTSAAVEYDIESGILAGIARINRASGQIQVGLRVISLRTHLYRKDALCATYRANVPSVGGVPENLSPVRVYQDQPLSSQPRPAGSPAPASDPPDIRTQVIPPSFTLSAIPTTDSRFDRHPIADLDVLDVAPDDEDDAGGFVPEDEIVFDGIVPDPSGFPELDVRAADSEGLERRHGE